MTVVKPAILLTDPDGFAAVNQVYASFFAPPHPARARVQVLARHNGAQVEIQAFIALN